MSGQTVFLTVTPAMRLSRDHRKPHSLLDEIDSDENMEPYLAGFDQRRIDDHEVENEHGDDRDDEEQHHRDFDDAELDVPGRIWGDKASNGLQPATRQRPSSKGGRRFPFAKHWPYPRLNWRGLAKAR